MKICRYLDTEPLKARAKAYDMVLNGSEIGGGSIRNHRSDDPVADSRSARESARNEAQAKFGFLLEALGLWRAATRRNRLWPGPIDHAAGGADSIRDVIAFPKTQTAQCPLTEAPSAVSADQLKELRIKLDLVE